MDLECRVLVQFEGGAWYAVEGRAAHIVLAVVLHQETINPVHKGVLEVAFEGPRLHPLRLTHSLPIRRLPP
jgi:hypothetical protein